MASGNPLDHQVDTVDKQRDLRMLMRDGGSGWMIPFELVKKFRNFPISRRPIRGAGLHLVISERSDRPELAAASGANRLEAWCAWSPRRQAPQRRISSVDLDVRSSEGITWPY